MRKIFRTAVSLAMGCALLSTSAFAVDYSGTVTYTDGKLGVSATDSKLANEQVALLVVKGTATELPTTLDENNILYIDQDAAVDGTFTKNDINIDEETAKAGFAVFAGHQSNTLERALLLGVQEAAPTKSVTISLATETKTGKEETITVEKVDVTGEPTFTINPAEGAKIEKNAKNNWAFTATKAGTYKITATVDGVVSEEVSITVNEATVTKDENKTIIKSAESKEPGAVENGVAAAMTVTMDEGITLDKMIWAFKVGEKYVFSTSKPFDTTVNGSVQIAASFVAGTITDKVEVTDVEAIFHGTDGTEYFTGADLSGYNSANQ